MRTVEEARAFIREVMGPSRRIIEGVEKEHLLIVFKLIDSSDMRYGTHVRNTVYHHAGKEYHHVECEGFDELTELLPENNNEKS